MKVRRERREESRVDQVHFEGLYQVHYTCLKSPSEPHLVYLVHPLEVDLVHLAKDVGEAKSQPSHPLEVDLVHPGVKTTAAGGVGILVCPWKKTAAGVGQDKAPIRVEG